MPEMSQSRPTVQHVFAQKGGGVQTAVVSFLLLPCAAVPSCVDLRTECPI